MRVLLCPLCFCRRKVPHSERNKYDSGDVNVLFEVTEGKMEEYLRMPALLREERVKADGFIFAERFSRVSTNGRLLSTSRGER